MRKRQVFESNIFIKLAKSIVPLLFTLAIIAMINVGIMQAGEANEAEGVRILEEALMRVAVHSYAVNGYFPESLAYIEEHFAVYIDRSRFVVHYNIFAANMLPDIRVFLR